MARKSTVKFLKDDKAHKRAQVKKHAGLAAERRKTERAAKGARTRTPYTSEEKDKIKDLVSRRYDAYVRRGRVKPDLSLIDVRDRPNTKFRDLVNAWTVPTGIGKNPDQAKELEHLDEKGGSEVKELWRSLVENGHTLQSLYSLFKAENKKFIQEKQAAARGVNLETVDTSKVEVEKSWSDSEEEGGEEAEE
ncbi:hypothetical protein RTBOTA2_006694 [Rhodotorula toruloides]|uniref:Uncharacterized protein n=1 Tax=Rhodotorula toruloides TaxID=5286 RepID=A0A2S9ZXV3_RHOTO|nr:hypothetical protein RTBOTA2_006694 [Rhodotorula toruloides]PRQ70574.1 hypothetical protein AAT19DRAFT_11323 [Rhodotorula toruloides]